MSHTDDDWRVRSDGLHSRVHAFIRSAPQNREPFEQLALDIARFQAERIPGFARLVESRHSALDNVQAIPAVPVEAFRLTRIAVHPRKDDVVRYETSGTTSGQPGIHAMRRTDTYRLSAIAFGRQALLPSGGSRGKRGCPIATGRRENIVARSDGADVHGRVRFGCIRYVRGAVRGGC